MKTLHDFWEWIKRLWQDITGQQKDDKLPGNDTETSTNEGAPPAPDNGGASPRGDDKPPGNDTDPTTDEGAPLAPGNGGASPRGDDKPPGNDTGTSTNEGAPPATGNGAAPQPKDDESQNNDTGTSTNEGAPPATGNGTTPDKAPTRATSKKPGKHGARRGDQEDPPTGQRTTPSHHPELICRETTERSWEIVVTGGKQVQLISVSQNGDALPIQGGECIIPSFTGTLKLSYEDEAGEQRSVQAPLSVATKDGPRTMIFKFPADWKGEGRRVSSITGGHYIVIAPKGFERLGAPPPVEPSPCRDAGFIAHYFHRSKGSGDEPCFELEGNVVFDDSLEGQLFVGAVPKLKLTSPENIFWVRVGEERKGGWKGENFNPAEKSLAEVLGDRQGRFFIRAYDKDVAMIDGGEFRYFRDLREIRMNDEPYTEPKTSLPGPDGHAATEITFAGAEGATLKAETKSPSAEAQGAGITARPSADGDCIKCKLSSGKNSVDVVLRLRRVWWRLESSEAQPGEWRAVPEVVTRERFRNLALAKATMRLRLPPEINAVFVGLDEKTDRKYPRDGDTKDFHVPLRDFIDYEQLDDQQYGRTSFNARFNDKDVDKTFPFLAVFDPLPAVVRFTSKPRKVLAGDAATLRWETANAPPGSVAIEPGIGQVEASGKTEVRPATTTTYTLAIAVPGNDGVAKTITVEVVCKPPKPSGNAPIAVIKGAKGWRQGKGFSSGELSSAGLTSQEVQNINLPFDKRRRSIHAPNVSKIQEFVNA